MKAVGPREERETIINFNDGEESAYIWTTSDIIYRRMRKRSWFPAFEADRHAEFVVPKKSIKLPINRAGKPKKLGGFGKRREQELSKTKTNEVSKTNGNNSKV